MKTYEKPRLMALSLSGNDQLCGSCANGETLNQGGPLADSLGWVVGNKDGELTREEANMLFGDTESQCKETYEGYCKFTSQDSGIDVVAWS